MAKPGERITFRKSDWQQVQSLVENDRALKSSKSFVAALRKDPFRYATIVPAIIDYSGDPKPSTVEPGEVVYIFPHEDDYVSKVNEFEQQAYCRIGRVFHDRRTYNCGIAITGFSANKQDGLVALEGICIAQICNTAEGVINTGNHNGRYRPIPSDVSTLRACGILRPCVSGYFRILDDASVDGALKSVPSGEYNYYAVVEFPVADPMCPFFAWLPSRNPPPNPPYPPDMTAIESFNECLFYPEGTHSMWGSNRVMAYGYASGGSSFDAPAYGRIGMARNAAMYQHSSETTRYNNGQDGVWLGIEYNYPVMDKWTCTPTYLESSKTLIYPVVRTLNGEPIIEYFYFDNIDVDGPLSKVYLVS